MFQLGELGDCFFLKFVDGSNTCNVLIDCGSFRNKKESQQRLRNIVTFLKNEPGSMPLHLVIGTHQHNDHLSGFVHANDLFTGNIEQVWLSWLDDPSDTMAKILGREHKNLVKQLKDIYKEASNLHLQPKLGVTKDVLGYFGVLDAVPVLPANGIKALKSLGSKPVQYLEPGDQQSLPGISPGRVKVHVLGPPRNKQMLTDITAGKTESFDHEMALASSGAHKLLSALKNRSTGEDIREEEEFPFNKVFKKSMDKADKDILRLYKKEPYRKIDEDWIDQANSLALYLDSYTNNSSLVLAFELVTSGKVLLFVGDAQTGNWNSWKSIPSSSGGFNLRNLLENTVLYKVGHHGSHNASLVEAIEAMKHEELVIMIPVDRKDPNITRERGWKMPAAGLFRKLKDISEHRVLMMDTGFDPDCNPNSGQGKEGWEKVEFKPRVDRKNGFVEYTVRG